MNRFTAISLTTATNDLAWYIWDRIAGRTVETCEGLAHAADRARSLNEQ